MRANKVVTISDGIFFPEDFKKLPKGTIIYIQEGKLINIKDNENENENKRKRKR